MFPYYPFLNQTPYQPYGIYSHPPINTWKNNQYHPLNFSNHIYGSYTENNKNYQEMILQQLKKNLQQEKSCQIKNQVNQPTTQCQYNQQISISVEQIPQDSVKMTKSSSQSKFKPKQSKRKVRSQRKDKAYVAKQYPKQQPSIKYRYIQKNFQLNIINQVFSFLWTQQKSTKYVKRYLKDDTKISLFYQYIKIVRKFSKRYINKEYLKNLCDYQPHHIAYKMVTKTSQKLQYLSIKEFSACIRHLIFIYLHQLCPQAILTSKKMRRQIWGEHLTKCRLLKNFIFYQMSHQEYEKQLIRNDDVAKILQSTSVDHEPSNISI